MSHSHTRQSFFSRIGSALIGLPAQKKHLFTTQHIINNVKLEFPHLAPLPPLSIHWKQNLNLQHLVNLPNNALSGPVQEDKVQAHNFLKNIVEKEEYSLNLFDLRGIHGIHLNRPEVLQYKDFESLSSSELCRSIRIISMRDFTRVLDKVMPGYESKQPIRLCNAQWLGLNYFWSDERYALEFICAVVYARRRGLPMEVSAQVTRATLNSEALEQLQQHYHMLAMSENAWNENSFMQYLINYHVPYARLPLLRGSNPIEVLLLPRNNIHSDTLGIGLRSIGAQDATEFLLYLSQHDTISQP